MSSLDSTSSLPPYKEAELGVIIEQLVINIYQLGNIPSPQEQLFLNNLKHHPLALTAALHLLQSPTDIIVQQFATSLLIQVLQVTTADDVQNQTVGQIISAVRTNFHSDGNPAVTRIRRDLMVAIGYFLSTMAEWKDKFQELARFVDATFFETNTPNLVVLDTFYVFRDFCKRRPAQAQEAFALVARYFCDLLLRQLWTSDPRQAVYFQFMTDWIEDVKYTLTPPPEVGTLMVLVARYGY